ncbi:MAG: type VI secretion system tube protein Hcp [Gammaproteobacteria bacterium]|nr:MAG: type VI secretion system tube protein Hcp [Gammaproteobacteria bacterium]TLZ39066.1 MAG: type VI secretion system tube protein Hcp [Gammaproteobacteria bacterium]
MAIAAMYLRIKGITGESLAGNHAGEIDLISWGWGMTAGSPLSDGSSGSAASMRTINVVKQVDRATPALFQYLDTHKVVSDATLTVSKSSGGTPLEYVVIDMTRVRIMEVHVSTAGAELTEHVTLSCETLTFNYTPQASGGDQASAGISFTAIHPASGP